MCGRYSASRDAEALVADFEIDRVAVAQPLEPSWNVAPTDLVPVVLQRPARTDHDGVERPAERQLRSARWGLVPSWAKDTKGGARLINARAETVEEKPAFRAAFARRRCLLPADGFYEWYVPEDQRGVAKPRKQPFFVRPRDGAALAMAGLYEIWRDRALPEGEQTPWVWSVTVITTTAPDDVGRLHDRAPLLVPPDAVDRWLDPALTDPEGLLGALRPAVPGPLEAFPVSTEVNDVRHDGPQLVLPLDPA